MAGISFVDVLIVILSLVVTLCIAFYSSCKRKRKSNIDACEDYFLSGRTMPWYYVGASLFASNIGAEHFVGMAGTACFDGIAVALHEWLPIFLILLLGYLFYPIYNVSGIREDEMNPPDSPHRNQFNRNRQTITLELSELGDDYEDNGFYLDVGNGGPHSANDGIDMGDGGASSSKVNGGLSMDSQRNTASDDPRYRAEGRHRSAQKATMMIEGFHRSATREPFGSAAETNGHSGDKSSSFSTEPTKFLPTGYEPTEDLTRTRSTSPLVTDEVPSSSSIGSKEGPSGSPEAVGTGRIVLNEGSHGMMSSSSSHKREKEKSDYYRPISTIAEYVEGRYDEKCRAFVAVMSLITYVMTKSVMTLYAGALVFEVMTGESSSKAGVYLWSAFLVLLTALYTVAGGLHVVMVTDTVQLFIFFFGGLVGLSVSMYKVGGFSGMREHLPEHFLHINRDVGPYKSPWPLAILLISFYYWDFDQFMVQRVLSARSHYHVRQGVIFAGFLKIFSPFLICFPGMAARVFYEKCRLNADTFKHNELANDGKSIHQDLHQDVASHHLNADNPWCKHDLSVASEANKAYLYLVLYAFPTGCKGIIIASMLAAMLSSLSSIYNSSGSLFTLDLYKKWYRPSATDNEMLRAGQLWQIVMTCLTFAMIPVVQGSDTSFYVFAQEIMSHIMPPLVGMFLAAFFVPRVNHQGAFLGLIAGAFVGFLRFLTRSIIFMVVDSRTSVCRSNQADEDVASHRAPRQANVVADESLLYEDANQYSRGDGSQYSRGDRVLYEDALFQRDSPLQKDRSLMSILLNNSNTTSSFNKTTAEFNITVAPTDTTASSSSSSSTLGPTTTLDPSALGPSTQYAYTGDMSMSSSSTAPLYMTGSTNSSSSGVNIIPIYNQEKNGTVLVRNTNPLLQHNWWMCESFFAFSTQLLIFSMFVTLVVSLCFAAPPPEKLDGRTFHSVFFEMADAYGAYDRQDSSSDGSSHKGYVDRQSVAIGTAPTVLGKFDKEPGDKEMTIRNNLDPFRDRKELIISSIKPKKGDAYYRARDRRQNLVAISLCCIVGIIIIIFL